MDSRRAAARPWPSLVLATLSGACSNLPPPHLPPHREFDVVVRCVVAADGRLPMPSSTADTVVWSLRTDPPPVAELLGADGGRWFTYAPGTKVAIACRVRRYGTEPAANSVAGLFPAGASIDDTEVDPAPR